MLIVVVMIINRGNYDCQSVQLRFPVTGTEDNMDFWIGLTVFLILDAVLLGLSWYFAPDPINKDEP